MLPAVASLRKMGECVQMQTAVCNCGGNIYFCSQIKQVLMFALIIRQRS